MSAWSITGYRISNLESASTALDLIDLDTTALISDTEDVDMTEAIVNFSKQEMALEAVMASSAKILQTSLLNFLK
jgi:flagellar hook-associated protein 3 FlgL